MNINKRSDRPRFFSTPVLSALGAAFLWGASTPFSKQILGESSPVLMAGLLYLGCGSGLLAVMLVRDRGLRNFGLPRRHWVWFLLSILCGGVAAPVLLMEGLARTGAATASLLLNVETVFTVLLAWLAFRENAGRGVMVGMALIVAGGVALAWPSGALGAEGMFGPVAIAGACLCWAVDNNLTRKISDADAMFIACGKGFAAGTISSSVALATGAVLPAWGALGHAMLVGFFGYGVSLVLFVLALRGLGTARSGAYFATAPFIGAAVSILGFGDKVSGGFWLASALMGGGVWLHLTETHEHMHTHDPLEHTHSHRHDLHHSHQHDFPWDGNEPHTHEHAHEPTTHSHPHYPDIHHRHTH
jgi:drug/metabolite transporter (DMT)-like permease